MRDLVRQLGGAVYLLPLAVLVVSVVGVAVIRARMRAGWQTSVAVRRTLLTAGLVLAVALPLILTLWPTPSGWGRVNLIPLSTLSRALAPGSGTAVQIALVANVVLLAPLGFLLPLRLVSFDRWARMLVVAVAFPAAIEFAQYLFSAGRSADIDDVLANALGIAVGYLLFDLLRPRERGPEPRRPPDAGAARGMRDGRHRGGSPAR